MTAQNYESAQPCAKRSATSSWSAAVCGVACTLLMLSGGALAQKAKKKPPLPEEDSVVYVVAKVQDEKKKVSDEIGETTNKIATLAMEQGQAEKARDDIDHRARLFNDSDESQRLAKEAEGYRATCAGRMLYGADIGRCDSALASIQPRLEEHNRIFANFRAQFDAQEALIRQKKNDQVLANARIAKLKNYLSWLTSADVKLAQSLVKDCKNMPRNATIEELKHRCGNIQFDGARVDLPACETERCQAWVVYAKPQRTAEQAIQDYKNSGKESPTRNPLLDKKSVPPPSAGGPR